MKRRDCSAQRADTISTARHSASHTRLDALLIRRHRKHTPLLCTVQSRSRHFIITSQHPFFTYSTSLPDCLRQWVMRSSLGKKHWMVYHFPIRAKNPLPGRLACLAAFRLPRMVLPGEPLPPLLAALTIVARAELRPHVLAGRLDNYCCCQEP